MVNQKRACPYLPVAIGLCGMQRDHDLSAFPGRD
jgi:hypothetical protein